ncbi:MAG TPA: TauD/TfdA family dioxygenase [Herpetosiphonaceae bacterium]
MTAAKKPGMFARKAVSVSEEGLIKTESLPTGEVIPLVVRPAVDRLSLVDWATNNRELLETMLLKHRALLFRDFNFSSVAEFEQFVKASSGELLEYRERSSPRSPVSGNVYTSTDYPADQTIFLHNEGTYWLTWPLKIFFCCVTAAEQGGETPIADCRNIFNRIDPKIRERFIEKQVMYVRNYGDGFGLSWQNAFQTTDQADVDAYCRKNVIETEWKPGNRLRTRQIRPAVRQHPTTGEMIWFNHATFFHVSTLAPEIAKALMAEFGEQDLPNNTYYGDGSPIEPSVLDELREIYRQETIAFPWQEGDVLMLDNMSVAHGRAPFVGQRKVVVGMSEPYSATLGANGRADA